MKHADFRQADDYSAYFDKYRAILAALLNHDPKMFELDQGLKIVDIGCGYGDLLNVLRSRGYRNIVGVEPDDLCRQAVLAAGFDVRVGTITDTGLEQSSVDAVIVYGVFHHIDNYIRASDEISRILKPAGLLCFMEPTPTWMRSVMDFLTFDTPLRKVSSSVQLRYEVMGREIETGLYPKFLSHQPEFRAALAKNFDKVWHKRRWLFEFGKYRRR